MSAVPQPAAGRRPRWRRLAAGLYLVACAAVVAALAGELAMAVARRWERERGERYRRANVFEQGREVGEGAGETLWAQPGVSYRPGARLVLDVAGERHEIVINSLGYRSPETTVAKPPGVVRVVCIGGSTTVQGPTNEDTYPAHLERKLRAALPGRVVEVLNLGINGVTSDHWLERADELYRFQPDVVVQYEFVNDLFFRHLPRYAEGHAGWTRARRSLLVARLAPPGGEELDDYFRRTVRNIRQMAAEAEAHGARHVVGAFAGPDVARARDGFDSYLDLNVEAWGGRYGLRFYAPYDRLRRDFNEHLRKAGADRRLRVAPVDEALDDPALFIDICHLTRPGIARLAEAFLPQVTEALAAPH
jgi:hypothetical protein